MNCESFLLLLEGHLDDELPPASARALDRHAGECPACAGELSLGRRVLDDLRAIPQIECPDDVYRQALDQLRHEPTERAPVRPPRFRLPRPRVLALAALLALAAGITTHRLLPRGGEIAYTAEEIALARQQVELALGLVADASRNAGIYLRDDVIPDHVLRPLGRRIQPQED